MQTNNLSLKTFWNTLWRGGLQLKRNGNLCNLTEGESSENRLSENGMRNGGNKYLRAAISYLGSGVTYYKGRELKCRHIGCYKFMF